MPRPSRRGPFRPARPDARRFGNVYTIIDKCADIRGGGEIVGGPSVITIAGPTRFSRDGENYRFCGTKVQF